LSGEEQKDENRKNESQVKGEERTDEAKGNVGFARWL
jgi:hypothetical protein